MFQIVKWTLAYIILETLYYYLTYYLTYNNTSSKLDSSIRFKIEDYRFSMSNNMRGQLLIYCTMYST